MEKHKYYPINVRNVGLRIIGLRIAHKWSRKDLANRVGMSVAILSAIEKGETKSPSIHYLHGIATTLKVDIGLLLYGGSLEKETGIDDISM